MGDFELKCCHVVMVVVVTELPPIPLFRGWFQRDLVVFILIESFI